MLMFLHPTSHNVAVDPIALYNGGYNSATDVKLRIGNGGAGQSGLIKSLANASIKSSVKNGSAAFKPAWYKSNTTESIHSLKDDAVDMGITYDLAAESLAIRQGVAKALSAQPNKTDNILTMFSSLHTAAENSSAPVRTRFLPRYDKSATSIKESDRWIGIGQLRCSSPAVPWATAYSTWYHHYIAYPFQALTAAILLEKDLQRQTTIYKAATDSLSDLVLYPAHILRIACPVSYEQGRPAVVTGFRKNGQQPYTGAPANKSAHL
ncbi:hypothetical protein BP00DRAFT_435280 [Aspergillus indologenus CBS 114.80]|uniref:PBP domain-containing protein n=1 Tax=Aspergillus indologenus CBS 114.80 TaxID=1450541 RepID=A0A2V5I8X2_9EURO|nr:hypothetical protein BP00DRAFT_435280 [Aspergillus indologenus CBS 114.80]